MTERWKADFGSIYLEDDSRKIAETVTLGLADIIVREHNAHEGLVEALYSARGYVFVPSISAIIEEALANIDTDAKKEARND